MMYNIYIYIYTRDYIIFMFITLQHTMLKDSVFWDLGWFFRGVFVISLRTNIQQSYHWNPGEDEPKDLAGCQR